MSILYAWPCLAVYFVREKKWISERKVISFPLPFVCYAYLTLNSAKSNKTGLGQRVKIRVNQVTENRHEFFGLMYTCTCITILFLYLLYWQGFNVHYNINIHLKTTLYRPKKKKKTNWRRVFSPTETNRNCEVLLTKVLGLLSFFNWLFFLLSLHELETMTSNNSQLTTLSVSQNYSMTFWIFFCSFKERKIPLLFFNAVLSFFPFITLILGIGIVVGTTTLI